MIPVESGYKVLGAFNPAAVQWQGKTYLLVRVAIAPAEAADPEYLQALRYNPHTDQLETELYKKSDLDSYEARFFFYQGRMLLTSISVFYLAVISPTGEITLSDKPILKPECREEEFGIEDPRISLIDGRIYIDYVGVSRHGVAVILKSTTDFETFRSEGTILPPNNKDAVIFPERINGQYYMIHRPSPAGVAVPEMWLATSPDLRHWGMHSVLLEPAFDWEGGRIGAGPQPLRTEIGWLLFYHGATEDHVYRVGAVVLDPEDPERVIWRSSEPLMVPEAAYENEGFFENVIFPTGLILNEDTLEIYYGASDTSCCQASVDIKKLVESIKAELENSSEQTEEKEI